MSDLPVRSCVARAVGLLLTAAFFVVALPGTLHAQWGDDSLSMEKLIAAENPSLPFVASARYRLIRQLRSSDLGGVRSMLSFMSRRAPSWLTPAEQLIAETLLSDTSLLRNIPRLEGLLAGAAMQPAQSSIYEDGLYQRERDLLRDRAEGVQDRLIEHEPAPAERLFFNLLVNHLYARGYRAQERINARVRDFAAQFPGSPLGSIAERYISKEYGEVPVGVAFTAGYGMGVFSGEISRRYNYFHGPMIGGEAYIYDITVAAWLNFGVAKAPLPFMAGGREWGAGSSPLINGAFDVGYELRFGRLSVTPVAGLALQSLRGADTTGADIESLPRTRDRLGFDAGVIVGYRMPFDVGPHIDFRIKLGRTQSALSDFDSGLAGALWYAQLAFALVQRPYQGR